MSKFLAQIQNYQIIKQAKLEFDKGLTIIVGPSNNGKSAIIRAIEAAIYNKAGNSFIKQGESCAAVGIQANGHTVVWKKSGDSGVYKVDGNTYNKIGRGQLVEVAEALNISEVDVNQDKVRINFLKQMEYPFLLNKTPSQLFEFLSMSNDNDKMVEVFQQMRSDLKETNNDINRQTGKIDTLNEVITSEEQQLKNYETVDTIVNKILALEDRVNSYNNLREAIEDIDSKRNELLMLKEQILKLNKVVEPLTSILESMSSKISTIQTLEESVKSVSQLQSDISQLQSDISAIENILASLDMSSLDKSAMIVSELSTEVQSLDAELASLKELESTISSLDTQVSNINEQLSQFEACPLCGSPLHNKEAHCANS